MECFFAFGADMLHRFLDDFRNQLWRGFQHHATFFDTSRVQKIFHQVGQPASVKTGTKKNFIFFCTYSIKSLLIFKVQNSLLLLTFSLLPIEEASSFFTTGFLYYSFCLLHCISDKVLTLKHNLYIFVVVNEHLINYVGKYISVILFQHTILG